jgi:hypothetical protein
MAGGLGRGAAFFRLAMAAASAARSRLERSTALLTTSPFVFTENSSTTTERNSACGRSSCMFAALAFPIHAATSCLYCWRAATAARSSSASGAVGVLGGLFDLATGFFLVLVLALAFGLALGLAVATLLGADLDCLAGAAFASMDVPVLLFASCAPKGVAPQNKAVTTSRILILMDKDPGNMLASFYSFAPAAPKRFAVWRQEWSESGASNRDRPRLNNNRGLSPNYVHRLRLFLVLLGLFIPQSHSLYSAFLFLLQHDGVLRRSLDQALECAFRRML